MIECNQCGEDLSNAADDQYAIKQSTDEHGAPLTLYFCVGCIADVEARKTSAMEAERRARHLDITLTTAPTVFGNRPYEEIDIITAECVFGMNLFRDTFNEIRNIVGGRSGASQKVLRDLRITCLQELRQEAHRVGADAVIAVDLDYSEMSNVGASNMLFLVASGTAIKFIDSCTSSEPFGLIAC